MTSNINAQRLFLVVTAVGLTPIALAYGIAPVATMRWLFDIDATLLDARHIFRAFMGLYLALSCFWVAGALVPRLRVPALWSLFVFMAGLATGRVISLAIDGWPHPLLVFYLFLEVVFGTVGWLMLQGADKTETQ